MPHCVGFHLCGAYIRNRVRRYGLLNELDQPDEEVEAVQGIKKANARVREWVRTFR